MRCRTWDWELSLSLQESRVCLDELLSLYSRGRDIVSYISGSVQETSSLHCLLRKYGPPRAGQVCLIPREYPLSFIVVKRLISQFISIPQVNRPKYVDPSTSTALIAAWLVHLGDPVLLACSWIITVAVEVNHPPEKDHPSHAADDQSHPWTFVIANLHRHRER